MCILALQMAGISFYEFYQGVGNLYKKGQLLNLLIMTTHPYTTYCLQHGSSCKLTLHTWVLCIQQSASSPVTGGKTGFG
jgi:hypothetical protein